ncbi:MAG: ABC transporter permease subunit [Verrucomicrobiae bacterium]|nr:ABC transporter permease subunit [Verrucomicrobiae bacterium]
MRRALDRTLTWGTALCAFIALGILAFLILAIVTRGLPAFSWSFLSEPMQRAGAAGGVRHNILGTLILLVTALAVCTPIATGLALTQAVYLRRESARRRLTTFLSLLNAVPSILFGLFGLLVFVHFLGWGKSWLIGGLLLGLMMLPTVAVSLATRIQALPQARIDSAAALGLRPSQVVRSVILPQCIGGLLTGSLLGLARAAGETAPILFTATVFAGATLPNGIRDNPVLTLPYHIFVLAQDTYNPDAAARVWTAALVLLAIVASLSLVTLPARLRAHEEARHD